MGDLRAGFARVEISPAASRPLVGYADRREPARGCHDPLHARALVLEAPGVRVAIVSVDLCYVGEDVVEAIRALAAAAAGVERERILIAATHTHSGPHDADADAWGGGLAPLVAEAVAAAADRLTGARLGAGWGALHGHSFNRRRLEDPIDPALAMLRVDALDGEPLGLLFTFGCHPVVLGPDNLDVSADWPGRATARLEEALGGDAVALFAQAGGADVNPTLEVLRSQVASGARTTTGAIYYGSEDDASSVSDRRRGTFDEMTALGDAVAAEALRVHRGIDPRHRDPGLSVTSALIPLEGAPDAAVGPRHTVELPRTGADEPLEVQLISFGGPGVVIVAQPGEVFAASAAGLRTDLRRAGVPFPLTIACANGWRGYLPPPAAYADGGYEVEWARAVGIDAGFQERVLDAARGASP